MSDKRKRTYVDATVQGALNRRLIVHWLVFLMASSVLAFMLHLLADPFTPLSDHLASLWRNQGPFLVAGIFLVPVFISDTIKLSHRFVGPISRIRGVMRKSGAGECCELVRLRPGDFWHELAGEFNAMLSRANLANSAGANDQTADETEELAV